MTTKKVNEHYVNNKEFTAAVAEYSAGIKEAKANDTELPKMSEYIGECIYKIATRLSTRPNFINYTYRDEMICDAIENCIQYIGNFNVEKSNNCRKFHFFYLIFAVETIQGRKLYEDKRY